jgi:hypothetical protein
MEMYITSLVNMDWFIYCTLTYLFKYETGSYIKNLDFYESLLSMIADLTDTFQQVMEPKKPGEKSNVNR